ncbi:MAG: beta-galactosidase [Lachnospiraceae bacterium]|nr:beta-galactosidase [Lachnospiraceae bacterium]
MKSKLVNFSSEIPRTDYPRPQWVRNNWYCLNGQWDFAFDFGKSGKARDMVLKGDYPLSILVPFCPESKLSGIEYKDFIPAVWYRRTLMFDEIPKGRAILHFGAVDYYCEIWVNGVFCGSHKGGYTSFAIEITRALKKGKNTVTVYVEDDQRSGRQARGKQCDEFNSSATSYTRTTGIYQTVWLEFVPEHYLKTAKITPHAADGTVDIRINADNAQMNEKIRITAKYKGKVVGKGEANISFNQATIHIKVDEIHIWNPGMPEIYDMIIELIDSNTGEVIDNVDSYFALRDISLNDRALTVNGQVIFMRMILDQGFHPEGVYTAPTDKALKHDIELSMSLGFNGARFHQRVFEERSLYWADQMGYLVWAEHCVRDLGGPQGLFDFLPEWIETIEQYYNHPAVIGWICSNETYHNMLLDSDVVRQLYRMTKILDPYRPVIESSGGVHYETDIYDVHDYEQNHEKLNEYLKPMLEDNDNFHCPISRYVNQVPLRKEIYAGQPYWISECGGTIWNSNEAELGWGYGSVPASEEDFVQRYESLIRVMAEHPRVCGFCWTQLTDIEQEQNGLFYYDRSPKFSKQLYDRIRSANVQIAKIEKDYL